jgi:tRNA G18 (ribose-2'-O)-methylase SpoU
LHAAAAMSGASLLLANDEESSDMGAVLSRGNELTRVDDLLDQFDHVIACEVTRRSRSVYEFAAPRGRVGVIVGNEVRGISKRLLKRADQVVSIPMLGRGMTSVNVAVAAAIVLYVLTHDLGRRRVRTSALTHRDVDVLISGASDPSEVGSLLRSAWAFGWQRLILDDSEGVWFTSDRATVLASRAAARRETNPIVVVPRREADLKQYDRIVICDKRRDGAPLSRFSLPSTGKVLLAYGDSEWLADSAAETDRIYVDQVVSDVDATFRLTGSIFLSMMSQLLRQQRRG